MLELELLPFQRRWLRRALAPDIRIAALSIPRGQGKSSLAAHIITRALTPGDPLFAPGCESHLCAASLGQVRRTTWRLLREMIADRPGLKWVENHAEVSVTHRTSGTRVSVLASSGKSAQGLVRCPLVVGDECSSWELAGGENMYAAIVEAQGKVGCDLRALFVSTLAPKPHGDTWFHDLISAGSHGDTYVYALTGDPKKWDQASEIRRCSPLMWKHPKSRRLLLDRRNEARGDSAAKARFMSFRLNCPSADETSVLVTLDDWQAVEARPVAPREGRPVCAIDLGQGRAFSTAVAVWPSGRVEAVALAPGQPSIKDQEKRDHVPASTYARLVERGVLRTDGLLRVPRVETLLALVRPWRPVVVVADRFKIGELLDAAGGHFRIQPRGTRWSESTFDIGALRRLVKDGPMSCPPDTAALIAASLAVTVVKGDDGGSIRLIKRANNRARDDTSAALTLAAGALARTPAPRETKLHLVA